VRIVLDTNVVISGLLWRGAPYRLLGVMREHTHIRLFTTAVLLQEVAEVLVRPAARQRLALIGRSVSEVLADYAEIVDVVTAGMVLQRVVTADPDDDHVIAAAIAAEADWIISGDQHLLALSHYHSIRIVTPAQALASLVS